MIKWRRKLELGLYTLLEVFHASILSALDYPKPRDEDPRNMIRLL